MQGGSLPFGQHSFNHRQHQVEPACVTLHTFTHIESANVCVCVCVRDGSLLSVDLQGSAAQRTVCLRDAACRVAAALPIHQHKHSSQTSVGWCAYHQRNYRSMFLIQCKYQPSLSLGALRLNRRQSSKIATAAYVFVAAY